jgi:hypothetical protein
MMQESSLDEVVNEVQGSGESRDDEQLPLHKEQQEEEKKDDTEDDDDDVRSLTMSKKLVGAPPMPSVNTNTIATVGGLTTQILPSTFMPTNSSPRQKPHPKDYLRHMHMNQGGGKKAGTSWWERVVVQRSSYVVEDLVSQYTVTSSFLQQPATRPVAVMDRIELDIGDLLGAGTYSNVYSIKKMELLPDFLTDIPEQNDLRQNLVVTANKKIAEMEAKQKQQQLSAALAAAAKEPTTGYAIKHLKPELLQNSKLFEAAAADLIMEAKFLANLDHPNILSLRAMALGDSSTFAATGLYDSYFIVVDEVQDTLIQRIHLWKLQGTTDQYRPAMILHKLRLAQQVASALAYMHERRLVFRDLKPHNIGLKDDLQTVQLFDFGFCRELPEPSAAVNAPKTKTIVGSQSGDDEDEDQRYIMSGKGTLKIENRVNARILLCSGA